MSTHRRDPPDRLPSDEEETGRRPPPSDAAVAQPAGVSPEGDVASGGDSTSGGDVTPWSLAKVVCTRPWMPATTAAHTQHFKLRHAFLLHVCVVLVGAVTLVSLVPLLERPWDAAWFTRIDRVFQAWEGLADDFARNPTKVTFSLLAWAFGFAALGISVALVVAPWGGRDERMRSTYANALRQTWLHAPHVFVGALACVAIVGLIVYSVQDWHRSHRLDYAAMERPLRPPQSLAISSPQWEEYRHEKAVYDAARATRFRRWQATQPWWVRHDDETAVGMCLGGVLWVLWGLLRSIAAPRSVQAPTRPPMCERCGYNLFGTPPGGRCSECGTPVADSLGASVRPGPDWCRRGVLGWYPAFLRTTHRAARRPAELGRRLSATAPTSDRSTFMRRWYCLLFVSAAIGIAVVLLAGNHWRMRAHELESLLFVCLCFSAVLCLVSFTGSLATASVVAWYFRARNQRNLLVYAMQMTAYLSGYLVLWVVFAGASGVAAIMMEQAGWFDSLLDYRYPNAEWIAFVVWFIPNVFWLIGYISAVARGTAATRFANR